MKKQCVLLLSVAMVLSFSVCALAANGSIMVTLGSTAATVNGEAKTLDVAPEAVTVNGGGVTFVPVRFITENLGLTNNWSAVAPNDVVLTSSGFNAKITIGSTAATVDGAAKTLLAAPYISNNRTMVPLRFISESLGYSVEFDAATSSISIGTPHQFGVWVVNMPAGCETQGVEQSVCTECGFVQYRSIAALDHNVDGSGNCTRCGKVVPLTYDNLTPQESSAALSVKYLASTEFTYSDNGYFTLRFFLQDSTKRYIAAPAILNLRIVNDDEQEVYSKAMKVAMSDFKTQPNGQTGYSLNINIADIKKGSAKYGKAFIQIQIPYYSPFGVKEKYVYDLPEKSMKLILPVLPAVLNDYNYSNKIESGVKITGIRYETSGDTMYIYFTGEKLYDIEGDRYSRACTIGWKLYESEGYVVDSGTAYSSALRVGEKFKDAKEYVFDLQKGETYRLEILDTD